MGNLINIPPLPCVCFRLLLYASACACLCVCMCVVQCIKSSVYWSSLGNLGLISPHSTLIHSKAASYQLARALQIQLSLLRQLFLNYTRIFSTTSGTQRGALTWDPVQIHP